MNEKLKAEISLLSSRPGVYLMKDKDDKIIYIGKAKNLKKRVSQYFLRSQNGKVAAMVSHVDHFDTILLSSEKEALILESNLIQTHYPRYNIMLTDDSHYPYIALKRKNDPFLKIARSSKDKSYYYFGPFPSSSSAYAIIDLLNKIYPTRKCRNIPKSPCLYYHLGQCLAPCVNKVDEKSNEELKDKIKSFLKGDVNEVKKELTVKMIDASNKLDFELASDYKKTIESIDYVISKQNVELRGEYVSFDAVAFSSRDSYCGVAILTYRNGLLLGKNIFVVETFSSLEETVLSVLEQYYLTRETPKYLATGALFLKQSLEDEFDMKVLLPKEGQIKDIVSIAELNAKNGLDEHFSSSRLEDDKEKLLGELSNLLKIKIPYRIELFDNSHLQGDSAVGAMVCFINAEPSKKNYRKFKLSEKNAGDDYHSMVEVVSRRYSRLKEEKLTFPDLILTDGGVSQVHACLEGLDIAKVKIPVFGLYKNDSHQTEGLIDKEGNAYKLDKKGSLFFFLMRMQDEVHRFAISYFRNTHTKKQMNSIFDGIKNLGDKRKELLRRTFTSKEALLKASVVELSQLLPKEVAASLYDKLHQQE
ncbi:MAG TPA: excinuclease ABC subunit C [Firmicutes bacterium]|nr:excinuclease ABC subunit C [Bacillota bacterium]